MRTMPVQALAGIQGPAPQDWGEKSPSKFGPLAPPVNSTMGMTVSRGADHRRRGVSLSLTPSADGPF